MEQQNTSARRRGCALRRCGGFTMVEVMVAVGVLLIAVMTAFGSQLTSYRLMSDSRDGNVAIGDLAACMEQMLLLPTASIPVPGSDYEMGQPIADYEGLHLRNQRIVPTYPGYNAAGSVPDPLTIVLTATWDDERGRGHQLVLRSQKAL